jgi:hypothetical protein
VSYDEFLALFGKVAKATAAGPTATAPPAGRADTRAAKRQKRR